jgi:hypothetical protein
MSEHGKGKLCRRSEPSAALYPQQALKPPQ